MTLKVLESAQEDLWRGYLFYEEQQPGVGDHFVDTIHAEIDSLVLYAGIHPIRNGHHRVLSSTFPFAIYYKLSNAVVTIHAVLDCRQDPRLIEDRLQ
jgi:plasmid stabilization system protein ParE